jgi:hypothetical protein
VVTFTPDGLKITAASSSLSVKTLSAIAQDFLPDVPFCKFDWTAVQPNPE